MILYKPVGFACLLVAIAPSLFAQSTLLAQASTRAMPSSSHTTARAINYVAIDAAAAQALAQAQSQPVISVVQPQQTQPSQISGSGEGPVLDPVAVIIAPTQPSDPGYVIGSANSGEPGGSASGGGATTGTGTGTGGQTVVAQGPLTQPDPGPSYVIGSGTGDGTGSQPTSPAAPAPAPGAPGSGYCMVPGYAPGSFYMSIGDC